MGPRWGGGGGGGEVVVVVIWPIIQKKTDCKSLLENGGEIIVLSDHVEWLIIN